MNDLETLFKRKEKITLTIQHCIFGQLSIQTQIKEVTTIYPTWMHDQDMHHVYGHQFNLGKYIFNPCPQHLLFYKKITHNNGIFNKFTFSNEHE